MITVTGAGFRQKNCCWIHAALTALGHIYQHSREGEFKELVDQAEALLQKAYKLRQHTNQPR